MRSINLIVIHCSATRCDRPYPVTQLIRDHDKRFGFTGYHYYIRRDGTVYNTRHVQLVGAHAAGFNEHSIGVCYEGGLDSRGQPADTRTKAQKIALLRLLAQLREAFHRPWSRATASWKVYTRIVRASTVRSIARRPVRDYWRQPLPYKGGERLRKRKPLHEKNGRGFQEE